MNREARKERKGIILAPLRSSRSLRFFSLRLGWHFHEKASPVKRGPTWRPPAAAVEGLPRWGGSRSDRGATPAGGPEGAPPRGPPPPPPGGRSGHPPGGLARTRPPPAGGRSV